MTIFYKVRNNLYVNLTNRCPCACTFCLRQTRDHMENSGSLWLDHEPSFEEVLNDLRARDYADSHRAAAPLKPAEDSVLVDTTGLSLENSVQKVLQVVRQKLG